MQNLMSVCHRCHMRIHAGEGEVKSLQGEVPETGAEHRARDREMP